MPKSDDPDEDFAQRNLEERIKPRHLRVVLAVQATGNMTKAGERLKLSQSSISKTISEVEETIGAQVFERRDKAWVTTEAGNKFVRMGLHVRNEIRILRDEINLLNRGHVGMVTIGVQSISAQPVMVKAISQVAKQFPSINIRLIEGSIDNLLQQLRDSQIDLVVGRMVAQLMASDLDGATIIVEPYAIVASSNHPFFDRGEPRWENCILEHWCLPLPETPVRNHLERTLAMLNLPLPTKRIESNSLITNLMIHQEMDIFSLVQMSVALRWRKRKLARLVPLQFLVNNPPMGLIWPKHGRFTPATKLVWEVFTSTIEKSRGTQIKASWPDTPF